uniref:Uncharacterized protein n=1 Tax=Anguilla anguilla TaxID=7936 RepID=A0A0E9R2D8_ANGAN
MRATEGLGKHRTAKIQQSCKDALQILNCEPLSAFST